MGTCCVQQNLIRRSVAGNSSKVFTRFLNRFICFMCIIYKYRTKTDSGGLVDFTKIWL